MRLIIRQRPEQVAQYIADYIVRRINNFAPTTERLFVLGLPTGSSPLPIYQALIAAYGQGKISFKYVVTFNMDDHVDINPQNVNILDGNASDLDEECRRYEDKVKALGGIDLFLGGVGSDGHIAFNEPGSSLTSRTRIKTLAYETIVANARFFNHNLDAVPRMALTVGVQTIMESREVVIIGTGASKATAIQQAVEGGVSHLCTLSCLQLHPNSMVVVDEDATLELKVKTVKYFASVERTMMHKAPALEIVTACASHKTGTTASSDPQEGELTPDSMSSRIDSPKARKMPFEIGHSIISGV